MNENKTKNKHANMDTVYLLNLPVYITGDFNCEVSDTQLKVQVQSVVHQFQVQKRSLDGQQRWASVGNVMARN